MKKFVILWLGINSLYVSAQILPAYVPTNSLSGFYSFLGNANDLSANSNNAIVYGATLTSDANGTQNSAYLFTPNNKIVTPVRSQSMAVGAPIPYSTALFTSFNANVIGTSLGSNGPDGLGHCLISSDSAGIGGISIGVVSGSLTACVGVHWMRKAFPFIAGTWYHVGLNFDAATQIAELFVNGTSIGTINVPPPFQNVYPSLYQMGYVSMPGTWNVAFNGKIDEAGIWNRALSKCEIKALYNQNLLTATLQPQSQSVIIGNTVYFTTGSSYINTNYQWQQNSGSGFMNITNTFPYSGTNTATLTIANVNNLNNNIMYRCFLSAASCSIITNAATLNVSGETGFNLLNPAESFASLYPNPSRGVFNLFITEKTQIKIFNTFGELVFECQSAEGDQQLDLSGQAVGIYLIEQRQGQSVKVLKLVLEN